jgi:hypothetical protein
MFSLDCTNIVLFQNSRFNFVLVRIYRNIQILVPCENKNMVHGKHCRP